MALHALRRNVMRSILTCLGIIIGIAAVIAIVEIGQGSAYAIQQAIATLGSNVVQIDPHSTSIAGVSTGTGAKATLTADDCEAIIRECPAVRLGAPSVDLRMQVVYGNRNWSPRNILGTTPPYFIVRNWPVDEGQPFTEADVRDAAMVCLIGQTPAHELFKNESPLGKYVRVKNAQLKVVGILKAKGADTAGNDQDDFFIAPWTTVKFRLSSSRSNSNQPPAAVASTVNTTNQLYPEVQQQLYAAQSTTRAQDSPMIVRFADMDDVWISVISPQNIPLAIDQIRALLRERHKLADGAPDDFNIRDLTEISEARTSASRLMASLLLCVALISLIVGGVGVMNIMLVSVTERTREIGLRMAVGARGRDILLQFLIEAVLLCLAGGITGILLGRGVSSAVTAFLHWRTMPSLAAVVIAVGVSATVGIIFGFYPAWKASQLDPIEALRYE